MLSDLKFAFKETGRYLLLALRALCFWRKDPPVTDIPSLANFIETRSKFVAQTTLYGYIKARAGTKYVSLYEDPLFAESVNIAKWEIWLACLCDLATYAVASIGRRTPARPGELDALAIEIVEHGTRSEDIPAERPQGFGDIREAYRKRVSGTAWNQIEPGERPFEGSLAALVKWAPIADELKMHDEEIVRNSMRFKWKNVRSQFEEIVDAEAVMEDWRWRSAEGLLRETSGETG